MQQLKELLDVAVASSSYDLGHTRPGDDGFVTYYGQRPDEVISAQQLREIIEHRTWQDKEHEMANRVQLSVPSSSLAQISDFVRAELDHCVDSSTDRIGHAFPGSNSFGIISLPDGRKSTFVSSVPPFAEALVRGAAILGTQRVASPDHQLASRSGHQRPHRSSHYLERVKRAAYGFRRFTHYQIRALLYAGKPNWELLNTITPR